MNARLRTTRIILLILVLATVATGCRSAEDPDVIFRDQRFHLVGQEDGLERYQSETGDSTLTIKRLSDEWDYAVESNGDTYLVSGTAGSFRVAFPDGRVLRRAHQGSMSTGSTEPGTRATFEDWDTVDALGILVLGSPTADPGQRARPAGMPLVGLILIAAGLVSALNPDLAFFLEIGWRMRDARPSEAYRVFSRILGVILVVVGLFLLFA